MTSLQKSLHFIIRVLPSNPSTLAHRVHSSSPTPDTMSEDVQIDDGKTVLDDQPSVVRPSKKKEHTKLLKLLTVMAYVFSVSLGAIVLSLYYVFLWNPQINKDGSSGCNNGEGCDYKSFWRWRLMRFDHEFNQPSTNKIMEMILFSPSNALKKDN
ncbi:hypothetical protein JTE90_022817 [Oedothorax gibbosus]|uniref:Transmembrane protein n=1 Tax=Oedothorax gibbosus TaxID=931172 RepID=A0AAV6V5S4_9ARAC|nr:hypothetical protein JTE90_022817 [Oedothorax gibbosus]